MDTPFDPPEPLELTTDPAALAAMFLAERAARLAERDARIAAEADAAEARSDASLARSAASANEAMITYLKLMIEKLKRELCGQSSERGTQKLDQLQRPSSRRSTADRRRSGCEPVRRPQSHSSTI